MKAKIMFIGLFYFFTQSLYANALNGMTDMWNSVCKLENKEVVRFEYKINITSNRATGCATTRKMCVNEILKEVKKEKYKLNPKQESNLHKYCNSKFKK